MKGTLGTPTGGGRVSAAQLSTYRIWKWGKENVMPEGGKKRQAGDGWVESQISALGLRS